MSLFIKDKENDVTLVAFGLMSQVMMKFTGWKYFWHILIAIACHPLFGNPSSRCLACISCWHSIPLKCQ